MWGVLDRCISKIEAAEARAAQRAADTQRKADERAAERAAKQAERDLERKKMLEHIKLQVRTKHVDFNILEPSAIHTARVIINSYLTEGSNSSLFGGKGKK